MYKIFIDTETTGLSSTQHGIWEIAFLIYKEDIELERVKYNLNIFPSDKIDPKALQIGGIHEIDLTKFASPTETYKKIKQTFEKYIDKYNSKSKFVMYAYNARFDYDFLRAWWEKNGDKYFGSYIWFPPVDVMNLAMNYLQHERANLPDFKLPTVAAYLGVNIDPSLLHTAMYDIEITKKIYEKINQSKEKK
jgi:DNA polymerase-3 subunit epsilon